MLFTITQSSNTSQSPDIVVTSGSTAAEKPLGLPRHTEMFGNIINNVQFVYQLTSSLLLLASIWFAVLNSRRLIASTAYTVALQSYTLTQRKSTGKIYITSMLSLLLLFSWLYTGVGASFGQLTATFAIKHTGFAVNDASLPTGIFWGVFTAGRDCAIFIARRLSPTKMVLCSLAYSLTALTVLSFALSLHYLVLWTFIGLLGFGLAAIFPLGISWAEELLHVSSSVSAVFSVGSAAGDTSLPATMAYLMVTVSSISMMYALLGFALLDSAIFHLCMLNKPGCCCSRHESHAQPIAGKAALEEADGSNSPALDT